MGPDPSMKGSSWVLLGVLSLGWGTRGVATRAALIEGVGPLQLVAIRLFIAAALVVGVQASIGRGFRFGRRLIGIGAVMAITNVLIPFWCFTIAYQFGSAGFVGLMAALTPLGTAVFAHFLVRDEPLTLGKVAGLMLALVGVAILLLSGDSGLADGGDPVLAVFWSLPAVASFSFSTVFAKREAASIRGTDILVVQFSTAAILISIPMLAGDTGLPAGLSAWLLLAYLAVGCTVIPLFMFYRVLVKSTAGQTALAGYLVPLVSVVAGVVLLGERITTGLLVGGVTILVGIVAAERVGFRPITTSG
jgi:drug/metabolite transporter (DMT)-like permease